MGHNVLYELETGERKILSGSAISGVKLPITRVDGMAFLDYLIDKKKRVNLTYA